MDDCRNSIEQYNLAVTVPNASFPNLQLLSKIQNLPGVKIVDAGSLPTSLTTGNTSVPTNPSTLFESGATLAKRIYTKARRGYSQEAVAAVDTIVELPPESDE